MSKEWFILQFKPNAHHQATRNLNQQGFETFLPLIDTTSRRASQFISATRPLFPGYMFVTFDKINAEWRKINNSYGVSRLVSFDSNLVSIPSKIISNLMKRCDLSGKLLPVRKLRKGDQVKVLEGPFAKFIATVEAYKTDQRIWILMDLMGRRAKVQSSTSSLQSLD